MSSSKPHSMCIDVATLALLAESYQEIWSTIEPATDDHNRDRLQKVLLDALVAAGRTPQRDRAAIVSYAATKVRKALV